MRLGRELLASMTGFCVTPRFARFAATLEKTDFERKLTRAVIALRKQSKTLLRCRLRPARVLQHRSAPWSSSLPSPMVAIGLLGALSIFALAYALSAQGPDPQRLFQGASDAQQRGDAALAVHEYQELVRLRPDMIAARSQLG